MSPEFAADWVAHGIDSPFGAASADLRTLPERSIPVGIEHRPNGALTHVPERIRPALQALRESHDFAGDLAREPWDFALEIATLRQLGLTSNDCRWLVARGLVFHADETTQAHHDRRMFTPCSNLSLRETSCFILTPEGLRIAYGLPGMSEPAIPAAEERHEQPIPLRRPDAVAALPRPRWDRARQELRVGSRLIKAFKVPATNQEAILAAFEEEDWPPRIDDPLPIKLNLDPKRRLHDTINSLNRNQKCALLRFFGDGSGQGVRWEFAPGVMLTHAAVRVS